MPQIRLRDEAGTIRQVARVLMRDAVGQLRLIKKIRMRDASNVLRTVYQALEATANSPVSGTGTTASITSAPSSCNASGGTPPWEYYWRAWNDDWATNNPDGISILSMNQPATSFRKSLIAGEVVSGTFECVVFDSLGAWAVAGPVEVTLTRT